MLQSHSSEVVSPAEHFMSQGIRALLLDDSNFDRARIRRLSNKTNLSIQLDEVGSIEELDRAVEVSNYDLFMIDYRLPVGDGMVALDHVLRNPLNKDAGKIMITGDGGLGTAVEAMRSGCHDFLSKEDISAERLRDSMLNAMTVAHERRQQELQVAHQREIIRQGLLAALSDSEVTDNVVSLVKKQLTRTKPDVPQDLFGMDAGDLDILLAGFGEEDDFIFH